jgi:hypothetical protein
MGAFAVPAAAEEVRADAAVPCRGMTGFVEKPGDEICSAEAERDHQM